MGLVPVCLSTSQPAFAGTHCAYPPRDGQAELTRVAGSVLSPSISDLVDCNILRRTEIILTKAAVVAKHGI